MEMIHGSSLPLVQSGIYLCLEVIIIIIFLPYTGTELTWAGTRKIISLVPDVSETPAGKIGPVWFDHLK